MRRKRSVLDEKTKLQVVEEGKIFRQAHSNAKKFGSNQVLDETIDSIDEHKVPLLLRSSNNIKTRSILKQPGSLKQKKKKVRFPAEAIVLSAAWDGDIVVLQQCINEVSVLA